MRQLSDGRGRDRRRRGLEHEPDRQERQGDQLRRRAAPRLLASTRSTRRSARSRSSSGAWPKAGRGRDRPLARRARSTSRSATRSGVEAQGSCEAVPRLRPRQVRRRATSTSAAPRSPASTSRPRRRSSDKVGKLDDIRISRKPGVTRPQLLAARCAAILPPADAGPERHGPGEDGRERHEELHQLPAGLPARLRRDRALRRRVRDRQLAVDHDRAADARVRDPADDRRLAAADPARRAARVAWCMGVLASVIGLFLGLALAKGLFALFDAVGFTLPNTGLLLRDADRDRVRSSSASSSRSSPACGPAMRATRVPPIAAVREGATLPPGRFARYRAYISGTLAVARVRVRSPIALFGSGLSTTAILVFMGLGALLIFIGVALFSSHLVVPLATVIGWPGAELGGAAGRARARELAAQPAAHRLDGGRADDRPRARHARRDARLGDPQLASSTPSTSSPRPTTRSRPRTTSTRSRSRPRIRSVRRRASTAVVGVREADVRMFGCDTQPDRDRPGRRAAC